MNRKVSLSVPLALAAALPLLAGCGEKPFIKVNGQTITREDYIKTMERMTIPLPGGQSVNAERFAIDQLVGNKVILAEAARLSVTPSDDSVKKLFNVQKKLFEQQSPGKNYEEELKRQGTTPEELQNDLKMQMAEVLVYARRLNLGEDEVRKAYDAKSAQLGLAARTQVRLILVGAKSAQFAQAQKLFGEKKPYEEIARQVNVLPQLRANGGLQVIADQSFPPPVLDKIKQAADGSFFGPVDWPLPGQPAAKAWVKVEKKLPAYKLSFEDAAPIVRQGLVREKVALPQNAKVRDEIMKLKLDARFESSDPNYVTVWEAVKQQARDAGVGQLAAGGGAAPALPGAPAPGAAAPVAPAPGAAKP